MSAGDAFGGGRVPRPVPPEKGVFPLDHLHECDLEKEDYISCLKYSGPESKKCTLLKEVLCEPNGKVFDGETGYDRAGIWKGS